MISPDHPRLMARYNQWQNRSLFNAADGLSEDARREDRGAFFRSIHETLSHILWADRIWLSRFDACEKPDVGMSGSTALYEDWAALKEARLVMDETITRWVGSLDETALSADLTWYSGAAGAEVTKPVWLLVTHIFNHQTHHRSQVTGAFHAMGIDYGATDIPWRPGAGYFAG